MMDGGYSEFIELYMGMYMCKTPNYPNTDEKLNKSLYNINFYDNFQLVTVNIVKKDEELLVDYKHDDEK